MNSPPDPSSEPPRDPSVPGPRDGADEWTAPGGAGHGAAPGYAPGYGDPFGAPSTGPYTGPGPAAGGPDPYDRGGPFGPGTVGWAPKPGVVPLRPLALGEILDGAVTYIRRHPRVVLGTSAVVAVVAHLVGVPLSRLIGGAPPNVGPTPTDPTVLASMLTAEATAVLPLRIVVAVATVILTGMLMVVVSRAVLGAPVDAGEAWRAVRPRIPGLVGVALLSGVLAALVIAVGAVPGALVIAAGATAGGAVLLVLGMLAGFVGALAVWVALSLAPAVFVLEGAGVVGALKRSWALVRPRFWPVLGVTVLAAVIGWFAGVLIALPFGGLTLAATALLGPGATTTVLGVLFQALAGVVATTLVIPFQSGVTGLLYVDQRMRREGFDIELQRAATFGP